MENENVTKDARAPAANDGDNVKKKLASNIMVLRYELNLSRAALADKVGTSEANIGQYERGGRTPPIDIICKFADVFNVPVDFLFGRGTENYDAVKEYRFEDAERFVQRQGFFVLETSQGTIEICKYNDNFAPSFQSERKTISVETIAKFDDRQSFIDFVEHFRDYVLYFFKKMFADCVNCMGRKVPFKPDFDIKYKGNLAEQLPF